MAFISSLMSVKFPIALEVKGNETCSRLFLGGTTNDIGQCPMDTMHQIKMTGSREAWLSLSAVMMMFSRFLPEFFFSKLFKEIQIGISKDLACTDLTQIGLKVSHVQILPHFHALNSSSL